MLVKTNELKETNCKWCNKGFAKGREGGCVNHKWRNREYYLKRKEVPEAIEPIDFAEPWITEKMLKEAHEYLRKHPAYKANRVLLELAKYPKKTQIWAAYNFEKASRRETSTIHFINRMQSLADSQP